MRFPKNGFNDKLPRKMKKHYLGVKQSRKKLRELISSVRIIKQTYPKPPTILPFPFCPNCGCKESYSVSHTVEYPQAWEEFFCARCHKIVGWIDNSSPTHVLM